MFRECVCERLTALPLFAACAVAVWRISAVFSPVSAPHFTADSVCEGYVPGFGPGTSGEDAVFPPHSPMCVCWRLPFHPNASLFPLFSSPQFSRTTVDRIGVFENTLKAYERGENVANVCVSHLFLSSHSLLSLSLSLSVCIRVCVLQTCCCCPVPWRHCPTPVQQTLLCYSHIRSTQS